MRGHVEFGWDDKHAARSNSRGRRARYEHVCAQVRRVRRGSARTARRPCWKARRSARGAGTICASAAAGQALEPGEGYCALSVDGTIAHTRRSEPCEYCVVLDVRNERGEQLTRQVVGVGVLQTGELRRLNVSVEMLPVRAPAAVKAQAPLKPPPCGGCARSPPPAAPRPSGQSTGRPATPARSSPPIWSTPPPPRPRCSAWAIIRKPASRAATPRARRRSALNAWACGT